MSHEVLITRRQSIFICFANPGRGGPHHPRQLAPASTGLLRPASAWICKKIKNALSSSYQDLMGHLILTTSPRSVLTWITLLCSDCSFKGYIYEICLSSIMEARIIKPKHFVIYQWLSLKTICVQSTNNLFPVFGLIIDTLHKYCLKNTLNLI